MGIIGTMWTLPQGAKPHQTNWRSERVGKTTLGERSQMRTPAVHRFLNACVGLQRIVPVGWLRPEERIGSADRE
jgi:hypothetical protein